MLKAREASEKLAVAKVRPFLLGMAGCGQAAHLLQGLTAASCNRV